MDEDAARDDKIARAIARKAFSSHVMFDAIGPLDAEAKALIREAVLRVWERAGSSFGALDRASTVSARLPGLVAADENNGLEAEGLSQARQVSLAEQAHAFLVSLAADIDPDPTR